MQIKNNNGKTKIDYKSTFDPLTTKGCLANIFYNQLIKGLEVTTESVASEYEGYELDDPENPVVKAGVSNLPYTSDLKKAISEVRKLFEMFGFQIMSSKDDDTQRKRKAFYFYSGEEKWPLHNFIEKARLIALREQISKKIKAKVPIIITYAPFVEPEETFSFHPHLIKKYNGRSFVFGVKELADGTTRRMVNLAIDRIVGDYRVSTSKYIQPLDDEYSPILDIVGVSLSWTKPNVKETIRLRILNQYVFGLITTKPMHHSQKTTIPFKKAEDGGMGYGEVELNVIPNIELRSRILSYGSSVQVTSPESFKHELADEILLMSNLYNNQKT